MKTITSEVPEGTMGFNGSMDVLKAIRRMEPAWMRVNGSNFRLVEYQDKKGELRPCYSLTKTECLYIATKFNDDARAKLVLRWEELEMEDVRRKRDDVRGMRDDVRGMMDDVRRKMGAGMRLLGCSKEEVLDEADDIIGEELDVLNADSDDCFTPTEIGRVFGLEGRDLNSFLADHGVIRWSCGQWRLTPRYSNQGLAENRSFIYHNRRGQRRTESRLVWTRKGRDMIMDMIN